MNHYPRIASLLVPLTVNLFDGNGVARTGEAGTTTLQIICLDNGRRLDADGTFKDAPVTPNFAVTANPAPFDALYEHRFNVSTWPRGNYMARFSTTAGELFDSEFTVGLQANRQLGYVAAYNGNNLSLSVWVEENGIIQTDYATLSTVRILNATGNVVAGGTLANNSSPNSGIFTFSPAVNLTPSTSYIVSLIAQVPGPNGITYSFPLCVGLARP